MTSGSLRAGPKTIAALIAIGAVYFTLLTMNARTRRPWNDEAMFANPAWNLAQHGFLGSTVIEEEGSGLPDIHRYTYTMFPLYLVALAGWFKLVGFGLLSMRMFMIMWNCVFLWEWWFLLKRWTESSAVALLGTALIAFDYDIMIAASFGRYDTMVAALGFGGYCCYLRWREHKFGVAVLASNACVAACGITHPNGLLFLIGLWSLIFYLDRRRLGWRYFGIAAVPYVLGGLLWGSYILKGPASFLTQMRTMSFHRIGLFTPLRSMAGEVERYAADFGLGGHSFGHSGVTILKVLPLVVYILSVAVFFLIRELRNNRIYRPFLLLMGVHLIYQTFVDGNKLSYYLILIIPFYAAVTAIVISYLWQRRLIWKTAIVVFIAGLASLQAGGVALRIRQNEYQRAYLPAVEYLQRHATGADLIMASCDLGFSYGFKPNLDDDIFLGYYTGKKPAYIVVDEIYAGNIDGWKINEPAVHQFIVDRLSHEYKEVYDQNGYRIYKRKI